MTPHDQRFPRAGANGSSAAGSNRNLLLRIASSAVLAPPAIACVYAGGWLFAVLCTLAGGAIVWEWSRLAAGRADAKIFGPGLVSLILALLFTALGRPEAACAVIVVGAVMAGGLVAGRPGDYRGSHPAIWAGSGVLYAGIAFLCPALLRRDPEWGFSATLFLLATVWLTDISAYFIGRAIGGPLLWPRVSPNKTWSGALGGAAGGVAGGVCVAYASGLDKMLILGVLALLLSVVAQAGDLLESAAKRHFGAKDASQLIPGHGGVMDRLDGLLVAALAALLIGILRQGIDAPAQGLLVW